MQKGTVISGDKYSDKMLKWLSNSISESLILKNFRGMPPNPHNNKIYKMKSQH